MSSIRKLIVTLEKSFEGLDVQIPSSGIEELAIDIHSALSVETRRFHTLEHVFALITPTAPMRSIAAVFHDLVYYQVDHGFPKPVNAVLDPYLQENGAEITFSHADDRSYQLLLELFSIAPGQTLLEINGLNEFFSALVAWKKLGGILAETMLLQIAVHIEATIPFRGLNDHQRGNFEALAEKLQCICQRYCIPMSGNEVDETVQSAVILANQDVAGFAHADPASFLDNTWKLLPESNVELRYGKIYTICDYRKALQKMATFIEWLEPEYIFHSYNGVPAEPEIREMARAADKNLGITREYLGVKLLAIAVLEAIAKLTGGDAPLALFMGDIQRSSEPQYRLENYLPSIENPNRLDTDGVLKRLLSDGRLGQSQFDLQNAPLASYLYENLGGQVCKKLLLSAYEMFNGELSALNFLQLIEFPALQSVLKACSRMVPTREQILNELVSAMSSNN